jgi:hypothetical protein
MFSKGVLFFKDKGFSVQASIWPESSNFFDALFKAPNSVEFLLAVLLIDFNFLRKKARLSAFHKGLDVSPSLSIDVL